MGEHVKTKNKVVVSMLATIMLAVGLMFATFTFNAFADDSSTLDASENEEMVIGISIDGLPASAVTEIKAKYNGKEVDYKDVLPLHLEKDNDYRYELSMGVGVNYLEIWYPNGASKATERWYFEIKTPIDYMLAGYDVPPTKYDGKLKYLDGSGNFALHYKVSDIPYTLNVTIEPVDPVEEGEEYPDMSGIVLSYFNKWGFLVGTATTDELGRASFEDLELDNLEGVVFARPFGYCDIAIFVAKSGFVSGTECFVSARLQPYYRANLWTQSFDPNHICFKITEVDCIKGKFYVNTFYLPSLQVKLPYNQTATYTILSDEDNYGTLYGQFYGDDEYYEIYIEPICAEGYQLKSWDCASLWGDVDSYLPGDRFPVWSEGGLWINATYQPTVGPVPPGPEPDPDPDPDPVPVPPVPGPVNPDNPVAQTGDNNGTAVASLALLMVAMVTCATMSIRRKQNF